LFGKDKKSSRESGVPRVEIDSIGPVKIGDSDRAIAETALRPLWLEMSRRRLLTDDGADENIDAMQRSAETLIDHVHTARLAISDGSALDTHLEAIQDACNRFRTEVQARGWDGYRTALRDLRENVQAAVYDINRLVPLHAGSTLAGKIDPMSAEFGFATFTPGPDGSGPS
jgi:hypothetical protein